MGNGVSIGGIGTSENDVKDMGPGGVKNQLPSVKQTAEMVRNQITSFNEYKNIPSQLYEVSHPNAQSDGDDFGKGDMGNNTVGSRKYIMVKNQLLYSSGNKYKPGGGYNNNNYSEQYW